MHIVIIGNGVSGVTTARYARKMNSKAKITIISGETEHHFSRTALMYIYMGHLRYKDTKPYEDFFWKKNRIDLVFDWAESIDYKGKKIRMKTLSDISYDKLVLAVGSKSNKFGWPGQDLPGVQGLYTYQDVELLEENTAYCRHAVIVGGGLIGIEFAEMLHTRDIPVTFLIREQSYWNNILPEQESRLVENQIFANGLAIERNVDLKEIFAGEDGRVRSVLLKDGREILCDLVALTPGVSPAVDFLKNSDLKIERGIVVNDFLETNIEDVYALGDCAQFATPKENHPPIEQLWYTGKMQAKALAATLTGKKRAYDRGTWYNSAKFFDLEYQTYGAMFNQTKEQEETFYWESYNKKHAFRITWNTKDKSIVGMNFFGIRFEHPLAEKWIREGRNYEECLSELALGNFDPEFFEKHESKIIKAYNFKYSKAIEVKKKRGFLSSLFK